MHYICILCPTFVLVACCNLSCGLFLCSRWHREFSRPQSYRGLSSLWKEFLHSVKSGQPSMKFGRQWSWQCRASIVSSACLENPSCPAEWLSSTTRGGFCTCTWPFPPQDWSRSMLWRHSRLWSMQLDVLFSMQVVAWAIIMELAS